MPDLDVVELQAEGYRLEIRRRLGVPVSIFTLTFCNKWS
jgi:hypothetical protein